MTQPLRHDVTLTLPDLTSAWEGLRIVQVSDLHCSRLRPRYEQLRRELANLEPVDLVFFTGDYMNHPGDEPVAEQLVRQLLAVLHPRLGVFGVFGNHDSILLRQTLANAPIRWLTDEAVTVTDQDAAMEIMGFAGDRHTRPDAVALLKNRPECGGRSLRLLLSHYPTYLPTAADLGVQIMFSGHTHGGQIRLPLIGATYNSSDLPLRFSTGVLRYRQTLAVVSRGLGETFIPMRFLCKPHLLVSTLKKGPLPGQQSSHIENVQPW